MSSSSGMRAVILAGGRGTRLGPYTAVLPKPLAPVGDMPILEVLLRRLARAGVTHVALAVNHLASLIQAYFGDGRNFGLELEYVIEDKPLGTAGPLAGIAGLDRSFFVVNGDLLTDLDFADFAAAHARGGAAVTIALYRREVELDFGVIELGSDRQVLDYYEKPVHQHFISMGAYVMEPRVLRHVAPGERLDLPDLIRLLVRKGERVASYHHEGYWLDIGRPDDYSQAQKDFPRMRALLLGDGKETAI